MKRYAGFARSAILLSRGERANRAVVAPTIAEYETHVPRSYIGWAGSRGYVARAHNAAGQHAQAKMVCERALAHVTEADREYVMLFITLDLELAVADAALGRADDAIHRIDGLLRRYEESCHPLALGLLHETRAHIAWTAGKVAEYERSLHETERWFLPTKEPALIAKCKRLEERRGEAGQETADRSSGATTAGAVSSARELERTVVSGRARRTSEG